MQDDNQEHMQYLLTQKAYGAWVLTLNQAKVEKLYKIHGFLRVKKLYLKEHGLPLDSEIKD